MLVLECFTYAPCGLTCTQIFFSHQDFAQAWTDHNSGERCLVLGGDPRMYSKGIAHQVFVDGRLHLVRGAHYI